MIIIVIVIVKFSVDTVELMDRTGELVNLAERAQSTDLVSSLLKERESYVPLRVSREFVLTLFQYTSDSTVPVKKIMIHKQLCMFSHSGAEGCEAPKYSAMFDFGTSYPDLAGKLLFLSYSSISEFKDMENLVS